MKSSLPTELTEDGSRITPYASPLGRITVGSVFASFSIFEHTVRRAQLDLKALASVLWNVELDSGGSSTRNGAGQPSLLIRLAGFEYNGAELIDDPDNVPSRVIGVKSERQETGSLVLHAPAAVVNLHASGKATMLTAHSDSGARLHAWSVVDAINRAVRLAGITLPLNKDGRTLASISLYDFRITAVSAFYRPAHLLEDSGRHGGVHLQLAHAKLSQLDVQSLGARVDILSDLHDTKLRVDIILGIQTPTPRTIRVNIASTGVASGSRVPNIHDFEFVIHNIIGPVIASSLRTAI